MIKNIEKAKAVNFAELVKVQSGQVISRTLAQNPALSLTLFAFAKGEEISSHKSNGDALVVILEGKAKITLGDEVLFPVAGEAVLMPAGVPHALEAEEDFKMSLTVVF